MRLCLLVGFAYCVCSFALNPNLDVSQYGHKSWTIRDGLLKGRILSLAQTPDGYLWLGTEFGLLHFDGIRTTAWNPPPGQQLASQFVRSLLSARDGTLWIGTTKELVSWKSGKLVKYPEFAGRDTYRIFEDREGSIWAGGFEISASRICAIQTDGVNCYGGNGEFGTGPSAIYEDHSRNLWFSVLEGLWRWKPGPPEFFPIPGQRHGGAFDEDGHGALLLGTDNGILRFSDGKAQAYVLPGVPSDGSVRSLLRDHDGVLWIGTLTHGLLHLRQGRVSAFTPADGLSGNDVFRLLEDREGNIWLATEKGLDRFRELAVSTFSESQGASEPIAYTALAARDGSVWLTNTDGLKRWNRGEATTYRRHHEPLRRDQKRAVNEILDGALPDHLTSLFEDSRGRIWLASAGGLGRFENDHYVPVRGFPDGNVLSIVEDPAGGFLDLQSESRSTSPVA